MRLPDAWKGPYYEPRDIWLGVFWDREKIRVDPHEAYELLTVYVCLVPCFPIRMSWGENIHPFAAPDQRFDEVRR